ncbi:hypothetical protein BEI61_05149 [Eisenbergiella tayi]|uniref:Uncharacterized protein n=1 Tax=Eisenbergiella tayi TaxID=1432052 RepID=A0A1E3A6E8_9FIRM|nr:hypothetical protein BEI61_05149 [Eisenbergiella tayi]
MNERFPYGVTACSRKLIFGSTIILLSFQDKQRKQLLFDVKFKLTTLIISKKPGNTGISRDIRTEFTTDLLLSD